MILVDAAGGFGEAKGGYGACLAQVGKDGTEHPIAYGLWWRLGGAVSSIKFDLFLFFLLFTWVYFWLGQSRK